MKKSIYFAILLIFITSFATGCIKEKDKNNSQIPVSTTKETVVEPEVYSVYMKSVGDIMFHEYQLRRGYDAAKKSFDFSKSFVHVEKYLRDADYTIGNLETTFGGVNGNPDIITESRIYGFSGYPCFNTPDIAAKNIKDIGFDLLTTANNHSLDSREKGLYRTLDVLDNNGLLHVGTYRNQEESDKIKVVEINKIKFAFVSFTYGMNGFQTPDQKDYIINHINNYDENKLEEIYAMVKKAKEEKPDIIIVMPHFGNEYWEEPSEHQERIVDSLFASGADVILGSHPHVLQPIEVRDIVKENGDKKKGLVIYSQGNFLSSQKFDGAHKDLGVILGMEFNKTGDQAVTIDKITLTPTYTYWRDDVIGIFPVDEILEKQKSGEIQLTSLDINRMGFAQGYSVSHLLSRLTNPKLQKNGYSYEIDLTK